MRPRPVASVVTVTIPAVPIRAARPGPRTAPTEVRPAARTQMRSVPEKICA